LRRGLFFEALCGRQQADRFGKILNMGVPAQNCRPLNVGPPDLRSKNDLDVKEIVNLWAGKLRGSEVNAGQVLE
jgi:hypothetical protein